MLRPVPLPGLGGSARAGLAPRRGQGDERPVGVGGVDRRQHPHLGRPSRRDGVGVGPHCAQALDRAGERELGAGESLHKVPAPRR